MHAKFQGVTSSTDRRKTNNSSLESSRQGASNGGIFMSLASIDEMLFAFFCLATFRNISLSIGLEVTWLPSPDAAGYDDSNELYFIFLQPLNAKLIQFNFLVLSLSTHFWQVGVYINEFLNKIKAVFHISLDTFFQTNFKTLTQVA